MQRLLPLLLLLAPALQAQLSLNVTGPATVSSGRSATLTLSVSGSSGQNVSGLQWTLAPQAGLTFGTPIIGAPAATAGKGVYCNASTGICVIFGATNATPPVMSNNPLTDGIVATIPVTFASAPGTLNLPLAGLVGVNTSAATLTPVSGSVFSITVTPSHCDYNGDGAVNYLDTLAIINAIIGQTTCSASFAAGCSLTSLEAVMQNALGSACTL